MEILPIKTDILVPPQDDLLSKIQKSDFAPQEGDVVAITSKVVSIWQGRCVHQDEVSDKDALIKEEAEYYLERSEVPGGHVLYTQKEGLVVASAGIDTSNSDGYYVLWPEHIKETTTKLLEWLKKTYGLSKLYLVLTDSHSIPFRRGVTGIALSWAGFDPLYDYRKRKDLFGRDMQFSMIDLPDALAGAATLAMGEGKEQTPLALVRNAPFIDETQEHRVTEFLEYEIPLDEDMYAPFFKNANWKKGGAWTGE